MSNIKRIKTHIFGFDELIEDGFPKGSNILISGSAGTGKTIFSLEYIYNGVIKEKENGIYFTFEERKDSLIDQANQFGWDFEKEEKKSNLKIISIGTDNISNNTIKEIREIIKKTKAKRVVIDSITTLAFLTPENYSGNLNEYQIKKFLHNFLTTFKESKETTTIFISQKDDKNINNLSEYLCDGVIDIEYETLGGDFSRNLVIKKMRKTKNNSDLHPLEISKTGIKVHNLDEM